MLFLIPNSFTAAYRAATWHAADVERLASLPPHYFFESATVVPFEPRLKESNADGQGTVIPLRKPN
jgi:hypothetical protein